MVGLALLGCDVAIDHTHLALEESLLIAADLFIKGVDDGGVCALTPTQLHLYELRAELVTTELAHMAEHLAHQRLPNLLTALAALVPDVILQAALDTGPSIVVTLKTGLVTGSRTDATLRHLVVHWHKVLKLLIDLDQGANLVIRWKVIELIDL